MRLRGGRCLFCPDLNAQAHEPVEDDKIDKESKPTENITSHHIDAIGKEGKIDERPIF